MLHAAALFADRMGWNGPVVVELARVGVMMALVAAAVSPLLLPTPRWQGWYRWFGLAAGLAAAALLALALLNELDLVQSVALYGFRVDLPAPLSPGGIAYAALFVCAFAGLLVAVVWTVGEGGPSRLLGYGLVLVGAAGFQASTPNQILFATVGLLAMALGAVRTARQ